MIDLYSNKRIRPARRFFLIGLSLFLVFLGLFFLMFRLKGDSVNETVWRFSLKGKTLPKVFASYLSSKNALYSENADLREQLDEAQLELLNQGVYKNENEKLKEILGRKTNASLLLAQILAKPNRSPYDIIVVDVGSNDGVLEGQEVFAKGNIPIGNVAEVTNKNARIKLYSTPGTKTLATLEGTEIDIDLEGTGSGGFEITLPKDVDVHIGQAILNKNIHSRTIALVEGIVSTDRDSFKKVLAKSPVNIQELSWVQIATDQY